MSAYLGHTRNLLKKFR